LTNSGAIEIKLKMFPVLRRQDLYDDQLGVNIDNPDIDPADLMI
jgi:hypothetical protein